MLCLVWNGLCPRWGLGTPLHVWPGLVATVATVREPQRALQHEAVLQQQGCSPSLWDQSLSFKLMGHSFASQSGTQLCKQPGHGCPSPCHGTC